ncbi:MAG: hypothetical protein KF754_04015 [Planctomycetes bacterium]|nr:hypothetical protein [Planctomycetota bacterium]
MPLIACLLLSVFLGAHLPAQAGSSEADRALEEKDLAASLGGAVIRNADEARALPADVVAVGSLSKLDDGVLLELKKRAGLKTLYISVWVGADEWMTDASMDTLAGFSALETLHLINQPRVTGLGLAKLAKLKSLRRLLTSSCGVVIATHLAAFKKHGLIELSLQAGPSSALWDTLATMPELKRVDLAARPESADTPFKGIDKCKKLEHLGLTNTSLKAAQLDPITKLKTLKSLHLGERALMEWTDEVLAQLGKCKLLEGLKLHAQAILCSLTAKGFEKLHALTALRVLNIEWDFNKAMTRPMLTAWLANLPELMELRLSYCTGLDLDVAKSLPNPGKLQTYAFMCTDISNTAFTETLAALTGLQWLSVHSSSLTDDVAIDALLAAPDSLKFVEIYDSSKNLVNVPLRVNEQREGLKVVVNSR